MSALYHSHDNHGLRTQIYGRSPVALYRLSFFGPRPNYILMLGPVSIAWGPAGGVEEGQASIPEHLSRWSRIWWTPSGATAVSIDWTRDA